MSFWERLFGPLPSPPEPTPTQSPDEVYLRNLLQSLERAAQARLIGGRMESLGDGSDAEFLFGEEFWGAITRLLSGPEARLGIELLGRFVTLRPHDLGLAARLGEILCDRLDYELARPLLERLTHSPTHALRAHTLLAEAAERAGNIAEARLQWEAILAVDLDYPRARHHADELARQLPERTTPPPHGSTLSGVGDGKKNIGRYRLLRELGRGTSGAVYLAHDEELDRPLALKIIHPHHRAAHEAARGWTEARLAAAIRHSGVVAIYDLDEERQLIAMELCQGGSLAERLRVGPLPTDEALARARALYATLAAVHARGIVHGDVKPANLLFRDPGGDLVLGDFGVARLIGDSSTRDSRAGTLAYMAPEERQGDLSSAADVYAAGVVLVELLSGSDALSYWLRDRSALLRGEARWNGQLPPAVLATLGTRPLLPLLGRLLTADRARRPSAAETAHELQQW